MKIDEIFTGKKLKGDKVQILKSKPTSSQDERLHNVLDRLHNVQFFNGRYKASCPAHADENPSFSITEGRDAVLLKCWAGCSFDEILQALGIESQTLFYDYADRHTSPRPSPPQPRYEKEIPWNWRKPLNELVTVTETRAVIAEDYIAAIKDVDISTMNSESRESFEYQKALAQKWIDVGENAANMAYELTQRLRAEEVGR